MTGKIRVLVVDDSTFFRKRIVEMLNTDPRLEVVGTAGNGREALEQTRQLRPDVITMDIEMPEMNGIQAVRQIMAQQPTPVLMFSSLTYEGARATLDALDAGAVDFLPKQFNAVTTGAGKKECQLCLRVKAIARRPSAGLKRQPTPIAPAVQPRLQPKVQPRRGRSARMLVIGASTGGPIALQGILAALPARFTAPTVIAIHMPENFTKAFADRLDTLCKVQVREAKDGDIPTSATVLIAPGGKQLLFERRGSQTVLRVADSTPGQIYRPSVDKLFESAAQTLGDTALAMVLTGMGADGLQGAKLLKRAGASLWSQDEASCVVYGMPQAVESAGLSDRVLPLNEIGRALTEHFAQ